MTIRPAKVETFLDHFDTVAPRIRTFPGCEYLELWQDARFPNVCTTHSHWQDEGALEQYRESNLFRATWAEVKLLFAARPEAYSYSVARSATAIEDKVASDQTT